MSEFQVPNVRAWSPNFTVFLCFAQDAYEKGPWGRMNARDRGSLMYRYIATELLCNILLIVMSV